MAGVFSFHNRHRIRRYGVIIIICHNAKRIGLPIAMLHDAGAVSHSQCIENGLSITCFPELDHEGSEFVDLVDVQGGDFAFLIMIMVTTRQKGRKEEKQEKGTEVFHKEWFFRKVWKVLS